MTLGWVLILVPLFLIIGYGLIGVLGSIIMVPLLISLTQSKPYYKRHKKRYIFIYLLAALAISYSIYFLLVALNIIDTYFMFRKVAGFFLI